MKQRYTPPSASKPQIYLGHIPKGYVGTTRTVQHMQKLIREGVKNFYVRQKAIDILLEKGIKPKDYLGEITALFEWVQRNVRYTKDPFRLEVLHSPWRMLELRAGDCDDMTILLGAMLEAIGHPVRLVLAGPDPLRPRLFTHVYLEVFHKGRWIALDPTMPFPAGWAPRTFIKKIIHTERKPSMISEDVDLQGLDAATLTPEWLKGLIRAVRREGLKPGDERVQRLWNLLRQQRQIDQSQWLVGVLRFMWRKGLAVQPRPKTTRRFVEQLRRYRILPPPPVKQSDKQPSSLRPFAPKRLRRVRPVAIRPVSAATAQRLSGVTTPR